MSSAASRPATPGADDAESLHYARTQLGMVRPGETVFQLGAPPSH